MINLNIQVLGTVPSPETLKLPSLWSPWQRPSSPSEVCTKLSEKSSLSVTATNPSLSVSQNGTFDDRDGNELRRWQRWWQQWWSIIILSSLALDKGRPEDGARRLKPGWYWLRQTTVIKSLLLLLADNFQTMTSYCSALLVSSDKYIAVSLTVLSLFGNQSKNDEMPIQEIKVSWFGAQSFGCGLRSPSGPRVFIMLRHQNTL